MCERLLDKQTTPTMETLALYCGGSGGMFLQLNAELSDIYGTSQEIRFPYGKQYGWCVTHRRKKKHICDIFAENGAFTVMTRLSNRQFAELYEQLGTRGREAVDQKYPCGEGGWVRCRVAEERHLEDARLFLAAKCR